MKVTASEADVERMWQAARKGTDVTDKGGSAPYSEGAYAVLQALTGNGSVDEVIDRCAEDSEEFPY